MSVLKKEKKSNFKISAIVCIHIVYYYFHVKIDMVRKYDVQWILYGIMLKYAGISFFSKYIIYNELQYKSKR